MTAEALAKKIALLGAAGHPNLGDEAILFANMDYYKKNFPDSTLYVFCLNEKNCATIHGLRFPGAVFSDEFFNFCIRTFRTSGTADVKSSFENIWKILNTADDDQTKAVWNNCRTALDGADLLHVVGGGYFSFVDSPGLLFLAVTVRLARQFGVKVMFSGISFGEPQELGASILDDIFSPEDCIDVRDESAILALGSKGIPYIETCDDVLICPALDHGRQSDPAGAGRYICVQLLDEYGHLQDENDHSFITILSALDALCDAYRDLNIYFIQFCSGSDVGPVERLMGKSPNIRSRSKFIDMSFYHPVDAGKLLAGARFNIGMRYHFTLLSLLHSVPTLSLCSSAYKLRTLGRAFRWDNVIEFKSLKKEDILDFARRALGTNPSALVPERIYAPLCEAKLSMFRKALSAGAPAERCATAASAPAEGQSEPAPSPLSIAITHVVERRFDEAIAVLEAVAAERELSGGEAYYYGAALLHADGDIDAACRWLERAVALSGGGAWAHYHLAEAYSRRGRLMEALQALDRMLDEGGATLGRLLRQSVFTMCMNVITRDEASAPALRHTLRGVLLRLWALEAAAAD